MSQLEERIAQFRKMANDDPDNELGHYRLGQLLLEDGQHQEAIAAFRRTLELSPHFSKVYHLLGQALVGAGERDEAVTVLRQGFAVADERGDNIPRDDMAGMLAALGEETPQPRHAAHEEATGPAGDGFRCQRPVCMAGARARKLEEPPFDDELGRQIQESVCAWCWEEWMKNYSIKVINELRLDLSTEAGQNEYDRYMREFLGLEEAR